MKQSYEINVIGSIYIICIKKKFN